MIDYRFRRSEDLPCPACGGHGVDRVEQLRRALEYETRVHWFCMRVEEEQTWGYAPRNAPLVLIYMDPTARPSSIKDLADRVIANLIGARRRQGLGDGI